MYNHASLCAAYVIADVVEKLSPAHAGAQKYQVFVSTLNIKEIFHDK